MTASFAPVPEAAIYKNCNAVFWEEKVRAARDLRVVQFPAAYLSLDERSPQNPFRAPIAFATDGRHNARTNGCHSRELAILQFSFEEALH